MLLSSTSPRLSYGDRIKVNGKIRYLKLKDGKSVQIMTYPTFSLVKKGSESSLILKVRQRVISFFNSSLGPREASLMLGIVFGIKEEMPKQFNDQLRQAGLLHVIAASGMNITMVGGFMSSIFSYFLRRQLALALSIGGILLYAAFAGFEPSILRAAIMGVIVFSAQILGRQQAAFLGLGLAGFLMLFFSPSLLFDIGFELSFMATFGLIFLRPALLFSPKLKSLVERSVIGEDAVTTITAQLATLPILLINFGSYSLLSILVNALVLWTVPVLMIIGGVAAILGLIIPGIGVLATYFAIPILFYFEKVVETFGSISFGVSITSMPLLLIGGYYMILLGVGLGLRPKPDKTGPKK